MSEVRLQQGESFESMLRRFNRKVQQDRILSEYRRHEYFEKPTTQRKKKKAAKLRKSIRTTLKAMA